MKVSQTWYKTQQDDNVFRLSHVWSYSEDADVWRDVRRKEVGFQVEFKAKDRGIALKFK